MYQELLGNKKALESELRERNQQKKWLEEQLQEMKNTLKTEREGI